MINGSNIFEYTYDACGVRKSKSTNGNITSYTLEDSKVIQKHRANDNILLKHYYDSNGSIVSFDYNSDNYRYIINYKMLL